MLKFGIHSPIDLSLKLLNERSNLNSNCNYYHNFLSLILYFPQHIILSSVDLTALLQRKSVVFSPSQRSGDWPRATRVHQGQDCKHNPGLLGHSLNVTWDVSHTEKEVHQLAATSHRTVSTYFVDTHACYTSVGSPAAPREALQEQTPAGQTGELRELNFFYLGQFASTGWNTLPDSKPTRSHWP